MDWPVELALNDAVGAVTVFGALSVEHAASAASATNPNSDRL
jgi:hypothetical protein